MTRSEESNFNDCDYYATHDNKIIPTFSMTQFIHKSKEELDETINGILPCYTNDPSVISLAKRIRFNIFLVMTASFFAGYRFRCFVENRRS